jgi:hypothetical protein
MLCRVRAHLLTVDMVRARAQMAIDNDRLDVAQVLADFTHTPFDRTAAEASAGKKKTAISAAQPPKGPSRTDSK